MIKEEFSARCHFSPNKRLAIVLILIPIAQKLQTLSPSVPKIIKRVTVSAVCSNINCIYAEMVLKSCY